jgi:neutral ceramidase
VISGLANEYLQYFTTPEEYERQHYEGGSTLYGRASSYLVKDSLVGLTKALVAGKAAPKAYPYDPRNGLAPGAPPFPVGAAKGTVNTQPATTPRLLRAEFGWHGGPRGEDRPLDRAFVSVERHTKHGWRPTTSDLGLNILWDVDSENRYRAFWEVPRSAPRGRYRFVVTANRYGLHSHQFKVVNSTALRVHTASGGVTLSYPKPVVDQDLTYRPPIRAGRVMFRVDNHPYVVHFKDRRVVPLPKQAASGGSVVIPAGAARDRYGNRNTKPLTLRP